VATQLSIVNQVLRRLREESVNTVAATEYSKLIGEFLNQIIEEVGDAHNWSSDKRTVTVEVTGSPSEPIGLEEGSSYLYGGSSFTTERSSPVLDLRWKMPVASLAEGTDVDGTRREFYNYYDQQQLAALEARTPSGSGRSSGFLYQKTQDGTGWEVILDPTPDYDYFAFFDWYVPQEDLAVDGSDDDAVLRYNTRVLRLGALFLALNERGEEIGEPGNVADLNYNKSLTDAIYNDTLLSALANRYEFVPD
jgi:hypothetical protein